MPNWEEHFRYATMVRGIKIDRLTARKIDEFLDRPVAGRYKLAHHDLHNEIGIWLAKKIWGPVGGEYAKAHIELDRMPKHVRPNTHNSFDHKTSKVQTPNLGLIIKLFLFLVWVFSARSG
jgi:hypothetical protein